MFWKEKNAISYCEGVSNGHPDKLADLICDAILDEYLRNDPSSHVGIEALLSKDLICITGEVESSHEIDIASVVKSVLRESIPRSLSAFPEIDAIPLLVKVHHQSAELSRIKDLTQDQSIIFGYATKETPERMPFALVQTRNLFNYLEELKENQTLPFLRDDAKVLMRVNHQKKEIESILVSYQHAPEVDLQMMRHTIESHLRIWSDSYCEILVNPMGEFVTGSLLADTGVSGRKIIFETYGSEIPHGGGAMSGKDPYKVDRWAAYLARKMALTALDTYDLEQVTVELAFSPGSRGIFGILVDSFGSLSHRKEKGVADFLLKNFPVDVLSVVEKFQLAKPIFYQSSKRGAFGYTAPWDIS